MPITAEQMIQREVNCCLSSLVSTLANSSHDAVTLAVDGPRTAREGAKALADLCEQAFELACPIDDWEESALQAGWKFFADGGPEPDDPRQFWRALREDDEADEQEDDTDPETGVRSIIAANVRAACAFDHLDPYGREVFEHWSVSQWLADKLREHGEKVDDDFAGMCVWARTCTGQGIASDGVIQRIHAAMIAP